MTFLHRNGLLPDKSPSNELFSGRTSFGRTKVSDFLQLRFGDGLLLNRMHQRGWPVRTVMFHASVNVPRAGGCSTDVRHRHAHAATSPRRRAWRPPLPDMSLFRRFRSHLDSPSALCRSLRRPPLPGMSLFRRFRSHLDSPSALYRTLRRPPLPGMSLFRRFRSHLDGTSRGGPDP